MFNGLSTEFYRGLLKGLNPELASLIDCPKDFERFSPDDLADVWMIFGEIRDSSEKYPKFNRKFIPYFESRFNLYNTKNILHYRVNDGWLFLALEHQGRQTHLLGGFSEAGLVLARSLFPERPYAPRTVKKWTEAYLREKRGLAQVIHSMSTGVFRRIWEHEGSVWL